MICLFLNEKCRLELLAKVKDFMADDDWEENFFCITNWNYLKSYMTHKIQVAIDAGKKITSRFVGL